MSFLLASFKSAPVASRHHFFLAGGFATSRAVNSLRFAPAYTPTILSPGGEP
jgi:hypothetical protein